MRRSEQNFGQPTTLTGIASVLSSEKSYPPMMGTCSATGRTAELCEFRRHQHLARENDAPDWVYRLEEGWACRYRQFASGRRQITALFLPGELCEPQWLFQRRASGPVVALTRLRASRMPLDRDKLPGRGRIDDSMMLSAVMRLLDSQSEWIATLGRKSAVERVGSLFCDVLERLRTSGRAVGDRIPMPLTQGEIADVVGLTPIHVNRVLKWLRSEGLVQVGPRWIALPDPVKLGRVASGVTPPRNSASSCAC